MGGKLVIEIDFESPAAIDRLAHALAFIKQNLPENVENFDPDPAPTAQQVFASPAVLVPEKEAPPPPPPPQQPPAFVMPEAPTTSDVEREAPTTSDVERDADGVEWDARIHSASKKKLVKSQTWKLIRGVDKETVTKVLAELRANSVADSIPEEVAGGAVVPLSEVPPLTEDQTTFPEFLQYLTDKVALGTITDQNIFDALARRGLTKAVELAASPHLIPLVMRDLEAEVGL